MDGEEEREQLVPTLFSNFKLQTHTVTLEQMISTTDEFRTTATAPVRVGDGVASCQWRIGVGSAGIGIGLADIGISVGIGVGVSFFFKRLALYGVVVALLV